MADTGHVDALRQTDEAAPLSDTELDEIRARNRYLRTETAITKALLADKEELAMRAHHAEVNRDHAREELAKVQRELGRRLGPVGDNG